MKVKDVVSVTSDLHVQGIIIPKGTWGDIIQYDTSESIGVKFRQYRHLIYLNETYLNLEQDTDTRSGIFEPGDVEEALARSEPDMVNHPPHYQSDTGIECIDAIRAMLGREGFIAFLRGTILAYEWRLGRKDDPAQELGKIGWYQDRLRKAMLDE